MNNTDDPGIALTPLGKRVALALLIGGVIFLGTWALAEFLPPLGVAAVVLAGSAIAALLWQWWQEWTGRT